MPSRAPLDHHDPDPPAEGEGASAPGGVQSVARSITILEALARQGNASVAELAEELGVHKSTASRLVTELEHHDLVTQHEERGRYELGFGILRLAHTIPARLSLVNEAVGELRRLAEAHRETVNIAVLRQGWAVNVAQEIGPGAIGAYNWIGNLTPVHATSSGKVLLAAERPEVRTQILSDRGLERFTDHSITSRRTLDKQLRGIADEGWAAVEDEWEIGLSGIAVPVYDHMGTVVAALSISGPSFRFPGTDHDDVLADLKDAGRTVSRRLGYAPELDGPGPAADPSD